MTPTVEAASDFDTSVVSTRLIVIPIHVAHLAFNTGGFLLVRLTDLLYWRHWYTEIFLDLPEILRMEIFFNSRKEHTSGLLIDLLLALSICQQKLNANQTISLT